MEANGSELGGTAACVRVREKSTGPASMQSRADATRVRPPYVGVKLQKKQAGLDQKKKPHHSPTRGTARDPCIRHPNPETDEAYALSVSQWMVLQEEQQFPGNDVTQFRKEKRLKPTQGRTGPPPTISGTPPMYGF
jgi:hypothetical protein